MPAPVSAANPALDAAERLDLALVQLGHFQSRAKAQAAVRAGAVCVDGSVETKPSKVISPDAQIAVTLAEPAYVSRAAHKLVAALDAFEIGAKGKTCLDLGTSTGGFAQVLLERGARQVIGIEVGHGQLAPSLKNEPRLLLHEGLNARALTAGHVSRAPTLITCDVSFIGLEKVLPPALNLAAPNAHLVTLIKPQFEVGREAIGKGVVHSAEAQAAVCLKIRTWLECVHFVDVMGVIESPILGGDGNREFLLVGRLPAKGRNAERRRLALKERRS